MKVLSIVGVSLLFVFSFIFLKEGITGMYLYDVEENACSFNTECLLPEVCCHFYEESSGTCDYRANCDGIYLASKQEKSKLSYADPSEQEREEISFRIERPQRVRENSPLLVLGVLFLILGVLYVINKAGIEKRKKVKKRSK